MHFDDGFAYERRTEESPEWDEEVTACDPSQVKQRIRNLKQSSVGVNVHNPDASKNRSCVQAQLIRNALNDTVMNKQYLNLRK